MLPQHAGQAGRPAASNPKQPGAPPSTPSIDSIMSSASLYGSGAGYVPQAEVKPVDYGVQGILPMIRAPTKDAGPLTYGIELTSLFPTISSPEPVHSTFAGPWATSPIKREPDFQIPPAYIVNPPPKLSDKMDLFSDDTLFYIFYAMPKDQMQLQAARSLARRDWLYHKDLKVWLKRVEITSQGPNSETGTFICMDVSRWEEVRKDNFVLEYDKIERNYWSKLRRNVHSG